MTIQRENVAVKTARDKIREAVKAARDTRTPEGTLEKRAAYIARILRQGVK